MSKDDRWRWWVSGRTLVVALPAPWLVLGWAPLGGGFKRAALIVNHQIEMGDLAATEAPRAHLMSVVRALRNDSRSSIAVRHQAAAIGAIGGDSALRRNAAISENAAVGMMTGAKVARAGHATMRRKGLSVGAWCTAGCSNALRVGDRATAGIPRAAEANCFRSHPRTPGTINIIVAIDQPLTRSAMTEALQIAVEARVAALHEAGISSVRSGAVATGTGTDCIVVAAPTTTLANRANAILYCGKHTLPGELIGRAVMRSCATAIARSNPITGTPAWLKAPGEHGR